ncbi:nuclear transport factor 2 family protein [Planococcus salinus]|uniref:Nuclear transport factor 2 family protein n=1 Tax=Planococcus salinus TaxID=1848460 RepID=A0A3M8PBQ5_9BACL|nr:nuclear transport factor 2 family protein [Planococcus salinus]RNF41148.1 nuclear transport factor 2 family protein [Planococcus salinus]
MMTRENPQFLQSLNDAFIAGDTHFFEDNITDDVIWSIVGNSKIYGKTGFLNFVKENSNVQSTERSIDRVISEGLDLSVTGLIFTEKTAVSAYHDVYRFSGKGKGEIIELTSFLLKLD